MSKSKLLVVMLIAITLSSAAIYWFNQNPPGATMIDPSRPPEPILDPTDVEKIRTLQNTKEVFLLGPVSPDDTTVIVLSGLDETSGVASWLDLQTGQFEPIDSKLVELVPRGEIAWSSDQTALYLSNNANGDPVLVTLQRGTGEIQIETLQISGRPLGLAPNGSRLLIESGTQERMELAVLDLETDKIETLLSYVGGSSPVSISWTSDGSKLALVRYEVPPELAADPDTITEFATREAQGEIPLEQNVYLSSNIIDIFDLAESDFQPVTLHAADGDGYLFKEVNWSPDGQVLMVKTSSPSQPSGRAHPSYAAQGAFAGAGLVSILRCRSEPD